MRKKWASVTPARAAAKRKGSAYAAGKRLRRAFYYLRAEQIIRVCAAVSCC